MQEIENFVSGRVFIVDEPYESFLIPLVLSRASAGFPSPADDYIETAIDLNRELIRHPSATFFMRVAGDSMIDAGILPNSTLIVDRQIETKSGDIIIARIGEELCVKELFINETDGSILLFPKNDNYQPIEITEEMDFEVCGKVIVSFNQH
jgi:DNA polymerase V